MGKLSKCACHCASFHTNALFICNYNTQLTKKKMLWPSFTTLIILSATFDILLHLVQLNRSFITFQACVIFLKVIPIYIETPRCRKLCKPTKDIPKQNVKKRFTAWRPWTFLSSIFSPLLDSWRRDYKAFSDLALTHLQPSFNFRSAPALRSTRYVLFTNKLTLYLLLPLLWSLYLLGVLASTRVS